MQEEGGGQREVCPLSWARTTAATLLTAGGWQGCPEAAGGGVVLSLCKPGQGCWGWRVSWKADEMAVGKLSQGSPSEIKAKVRESRVA